MILNKQNLTAIEKTGMQVPSSSILNLPEKVLQFGTGVLLRGLCDYYIDNANKQNVFNGRIAVVKSTNGENEFALQDNLYTLCVRGVSDNTIIENNDINASISRVLIANLQWNEIINIATSSDLKIVLSNTTEVGIVYKEENILNSDKPPESFPAKLLALLYKRYLKFNGSMDSGLIIIPTELISNNANILKDIIVQLVAYNKLDEIFLNWLLHANMFCNTLVDRIVPGKPSGKLAEEINKQLSYQDNLKVVAEVYNLWAIQGNQYVRQILSFASVNPQIIIEEDIDIFRELKLRLLNGSHSFHCGLAYLSGFTIVREAFQNEAFNKFAKKLIYNEIAPSIPYDIDENTKEKFADSLFHRFVNPFLEHKWLDITLHYTSKMKMRNVALLINYYKNFNSVPTCMSIGFAAYIYFMKCSLAADGNYYGINKDGNEYKIQDAEAPYFAKLWQSLSIEDMVLTILQNENLWGTSLHEIPGFTNAVTQYLQDIQANGSFSLIQNIGVENYVK